MFIKDMLKTVLAIIIEISLNLFQIMIRMMKIINNFLFLFKQTFLFDFNKMENKSSHRC